MNTKVSVLLASLFLAALQPASAQYLTGVWYANEGSGSVIANYSPSTYRWDMNILGNPGLWGYWQPGAFAFANGADNAATEMTMAAAWTSGDDLTLKADFNVTASVHDVGTIFPGGSVFGAGYFISDPGGNALGFNYGAFYATINTANPAAPTIEFNLSGIAPGVWSQPLPASVTNAGINGGWNTAEWFMNNDSTANSMTLQFRLNGADIGSPINISGGFIPNYSGIGNYQGTKFYIGAAADENYKSFRGSLRNISLTATTQGAAAILQANTYAGVVIQGTPGALYQIQYTTDLSAPNWQTITNIAIPTSPYTWFDPQSAVTPKRFYRAITP